MQQILLRLLFGCRPLNRNITLTKLLDNFPQLLILKNQSLILNMIVLSRFLITLNRRERNRTIQRRIQSIKIPKKHSNLILEMRHLNKGEVIFMRFDIVDDLDVYLLKNKVQLVQYLLLHLEKYVLTRFVHHCYQMLKLTEIVFGLYHSRNNYSVGWRIHMFCQFGSMNSLSSAVSLFLSIDTTPAFPAAFDSTPSKTN